MALLIRRETICSRVLTTRGLIIQHSCEAEAFLAVARGQCMVARRGGSRPVRRTGTMTDRLEHVRAPCTAPFQ